MPNAQLVRRLGEPEKAQSLHQALSRNSAAARPNGARGHHCLENIFPTSPPQTPPARTSGRVPCPSGRVRLFVLPNGARRPLA